MYTHAVVVKPFNSHPLNAEPRVLAGPGYVRYTRMNRKPVIICAFAVPTGWGQLLRRGQCLRCRCQGFPTTLAEP